jgi:hypothetical protein
MMEMFDKVMVCLDQQLNTLLVSAPGMGKSSFTRWMAKELKVLHIDINLSQNEGIDVHGARVIAREPRMINGQSCTVTVQAPPDYAIDAVNAPIGALINFEELTCVPPAEAGPTLGIFSDYIIGGVRLNKEKVGITACCNPPEMSAGGWKLSLPTINRFVKLNFEQDVAEWAENFITYWEDPPTIKRWGRETPEAEWSQDRAVIASFAKQFPDLVNKPPEPGSSEESFCTYRTLDFASRIKTGCRLRGLREDQRQKLWAGALGGPVAKQLWEYLNTFDLPSPSELIDDPDAFDMSTVPSDKMFYLVMACVAELLNRKRQDDAKKTDKKFHAYVVKSWQNMWDVLLHIMKNNGPKDIVAAAGRRICDPQNYPKGAEPPMAAGEFVKVVRASGVDWRPNKK